MHPFMDVQEDFVLDKVNWKEPEEGMMDFFLTVSIKITVKLGGVNGGFEIGLQFDKSFFVFW